MLAILSNKELYYYLYNEVFLFIFDQMEITTYSNFRQHLKTFLEKVITSKAPLFVTRQGSEEVVVISKSDYEGMQETLHLLSSPKNAMRLKEAIEEYEEGGGEVHELID